LYNVMLINTTIMTDTVNTTPDGDFEFTVNYSERELTCRVKKDQNHLKVHLDNNSDAWLEIQPDGSLVQTSGTDLPASLIEFIKKHVLGQDK
jgi:hypothetical protein